VKKRIAALLSAVAVMLCLSGCSFVEIDVDGRLRAPHSVGEQNAIQTALEQHIFAQEEGSSLSYVMKYPKMGEYRSAYVMKDITGDGVQDALAFYSLQPEGAMTHIALLVKRDGAWACVDDVEGLATEIERIQFGDLDGDGTPEIFAGYSMYNTRDRRLVMYTWSEEHLVERYTDTYTKMVIDKITDEKCDDLMLFRLRAKDERATATLFTMKNGEVTEQSTAQINGNILQFGEYALCDLNDGTRALFQECSKDNNATITELLLWDGQSLTAPLYDPAENITRVSARESGLPATDINGDGIIEWPQSFRMAGYELVPTENMELWMSMWVTWDPKIEEPALVTTNIVNPYDGYCIEIPREWFGLVSADYNHETRRLTVRQVKDGAVSDELFHIVAYAAGEENPFKAEHNYLYLESTDKTRFELTYDRESEWELSMEKLNPLFSLYNG